MSVVSYKDIRNAAVQALATAFAPIRGLKVEAHPGRFDEAEIKRLAVLAPALLTSLMRISPAEGEDLQTMEFVTWVIVRADNQDTLFDRALALISLLTPTLRNLDTEWSIGGGQGIEATNLYTSSQGAINVSLWAVNWTWKVRANQVGISEGGILLPGALELFEGATAETLLS